MKCPYCGNREITLLRRTRWTKLIPGFEYYDCDNCGGTHSRFLVRPVHGFFIAIVTFLVTTAICRLIHQMPAPYYADIEKDIAAILEPAKVSGPIRDYPDRQEKLPVQAGEPSPAGLAEEAVDEKMPPPLPLVAEPVKETAQTDTGSGQKLQEKKEEKKPRIKVLIGDKKRTSAKRLAAQLEEMGYPVDTVHAAPRSTFRKLTIYHKEGFKASAEEIGKNTGKDFRVKKLSWESRFDIIVVTGGNEY